MSDTERRAALRQIGMILAVVVPVALLIFLWSGAFFDSYQGQVVAHRPLVGADGEGDQVLRYVLVRPGGTYEDIVLPNAAMERFKLPQSLSGVPPTMVPDEKAPRVRKEIFSFEVLVEGTAWSTLKASHLVVPLLLIVVSILARNLVTTGSAIQLVPRGASALPGLQQEAAGVVAPAPKPKPQKAPPPGVGAKRGKRGKRPR